MAKKSSRVILMERDRELLLFLFENRGGTLSDLGKDIFQVKQRQTIQRRLKKLRDAHFIGMDISMDLPGRYFYFIQPRGLKRCHPKSKTLKGLRLKSPDVRHDFLLIQVRNVLEKAKIIHTYYTENMMFLDSFRWQIEDVFKYDRLTSSGCPFHYGG